MLEVHGFFCRNGWGRIWICQWSGFWEHLQESSDFPIFCVGLSCKCSLTLWLFNIAMENGPFIDGLPLKMRIFHGYVSHNRMLNQSIEHGKIHV